MKARKRRTPRRARRTTALEPDGGGDERAAAVLAPRRALTPSEAEDDFEDGRTAGGLYSRSEEDWAARGDVGSRRKDLRAGPFSVEFGDPATTAPPVPKPEFRRPPSEGGVYVPPGGLTRLRKRSHPAKSRARRRRPARRPSFGR
jgi:hypothetical protein